MSVNMQEINSKLWIMGWIMEGAKRGLLYIPDGGSEARRGEGSEGIKGAILGDVKPGLR